MNDHQRRVLQSFRRVQDFLDAHPIGGNPSSAARHRVALDEAVRRIEENAVGQYAARSEGSSDSRRGERLRQAMRAEQLKPIVRVARALAAEHPELATLTKLPPVQADTVSLLAAAGAIADAAAPHEALLVENGLPADFLAQLRAAIAELRDGMDDRGNSVRRRAGATAAIDEALDRGRRAIQLIGTMVERAAKTDPQLMAEWRSASRVTPKVGRPSGVTPPANVTPIGDAHPIEHQASTQG